MADLVSKFKKTLYPLIREHNLHVIFMFSTERRESIALAVEVLEREFSPDEIFTLEDLFRKYAQLSENRAFRSLIVFIAIFPIVIILNRMLSLQFSGAYFLLALTLWLVTNIIEKKRERMNFASLNIVRYSVGKSLLKWSDYNDL